MSSHILSLKPCSPVAPVSYIIQSFSLVPYRNKPREGKQLTRSRIRLHSRCSSCEPVLLASSQETAALGHGVANRLCGARQNHSLPLGAVGPLFYCPCPGHIDGGAVPICPHSPAISCFFGLIPRQKNNRLISSLFKSQLCCAQLLHRKLVALYSRLLSSAELCESAGASWCRRLSIISKSELLVTIHRYCTTLSKRRCYIIFVIFLQTCSILSVFTMASHTMPSPVRTVRNIPSRQTLHRSSGSSSSSDYQMFRSATEKEYIGSDSNARNKKKWLGQVKNWLSVSEPSAQAMKAQKRDTYKKHGIDPKDPDAAVKMHLPLGTLPRDAITSTSGPTPEERLAKEQQNRPHYLKHGSSQSVSSGSSSPSIREINHIAPWEN